MLIQNLAALKALPVGTVLREPIRNDLVEIVVRNGQAGVEIAGRWLPRGVLRERDFPMTLLTSPTPSATVSPAVAAEMENLAARCWEAGHDAATSGYDLSTNPFRQIG